MYPWHGPEAEPAGELGDERCERNGTAAVDRRWLNRACLQRKELPNHPGVQPRCASPRVQERIFEGDCCSGGHAGAVADEDAFRCEPAEGVSGWGKSQYRVDPEAFVAGEEVAARPDGFGDQQGAVVRVVDRNFLPESVVDDGVCFESGVGDVVGKAGHRRVELVSDAVEELGEINRHVVAVCECGGVARVAIETDDDAGNLAEFGEQSIDPLDVDRIEHPDIVARGRAVAVDGEGVARALHPLVGMGDPADATVEAVGFNELGCALVDAKGHASCYVGSSHKRDSG